MPHYRVDPSVSENTGIYGYNRSRFFNKYKRYIMTQSNQELISIDREIHAQIVMTTESVK